MNKYLKVMFGTTSGADKNLEYKIGEVNVANNWNPIAIKGREFGGFNFSTEDKIIRWLHRGDTLYNVEIPKDAEMIDIVDSATPHGVLRSNKIIISNPRKVTDEMALELYKKSNIPEIAYYKALGAVSVMNYKNTALAIFRDKVNKDNIDIVLEEWNDFINKGNREGSNATVNMINEFLLEIKSELLISINVDKDPYIKEISNDKIINVTGESGSGKSTYTKKYLDNDNYIVIDTDEIKGNRPTNNKNSLEIREFLLKKYGENIPDICQNFNIIYKDILAYYKDTDKYLVIDSAQYRNLKTKKDINLLKGKIIVVRTSIDTCYERCINRWKNIIKNYTTEELETYKNKKLGMYSWYKSLNEFLLNIDKL